MKDHQYFNLIELLVCIAVLTILTSLLMPVFSTIRERAKIISCAGNLKQIGHCIQSYASEKNGCIPAAQGEPIEYHTGVWTGYPRHIGLVYRTLYNKAPEFISCPGASYLKADSSLFGIDNWGSSDWVRSSYQCRMALDSSGINPIFSRNDATPAILLDAHFGNTSLATKTGSVSAEVFCHRYRHTNILYYDGRVVGKNNENGRFGAVGVPLTNPFLYADEEF